MTDTEPVLEVLEYNELVKKVNLCSHPVINSKLTALRRSETSSKHFRELMREMTSFLGYKATEDLATKEVMVSTPVAQHTGCEVSTSVALVPIMRSGNGMVEAMLDVLPSAPVFHLGLYRDKHSLLPTLYYNKLSSKCNVDRVIVLEPLIATSGTINAVIDILEEWGATDIHIVSLIGSRKGLSQLLATHPDVKIHISAIDDKLSEDGIVVPGLGDSGERLYNTSKPHEEPPSPKRARLA